MRSSSSTLLSRKEHPKPLINSDLQDSRDPVALLDQEELVPNLPRHPLRDQHLPTQGQEVWALVAWEVLEAWQDQVNLR